MKKTVISYYFIIFICFGILFFRLTQLTIVKGADNRLSADSQRIRVAEVFSPRGIIFDRNEKPLVHNMPVFKKCPVNTLECEYISREDALKMEAEGKDSELVIGVGRSYPYFESMSHLLGYLGEATEDEVRNGGMSIGDMVGRTGIEQEYELLLRGVPGGELVEVNTQGVTVRKVGKKEPVPGKDIIISINADLQNAAYQAFEGKRGAVVVSKPDTGEILALVSSPGFDPTVFVNKNQQDGDQITKILNDKGMPLFNRAISGSYAPGSTFKIVTSTAGLEEGKITTQTLIEDTGVIVVGAYRYNNWYYTQYGKTEGNINVVTALKRSTDTFFYKLGEMVGAPVLMDWAKKYGLGKATGVDLPGEISGYIPDPRTKDWYLGNTYHLAIGQGDLMLTPLQVNQMTSVIASGGKLCRPHLLIREMLDNGSKNIQTTQCVDIGIKKETIATITEGMKEACAPGGTAFPFFDFKPQVACKTGTAELGDVAQSTHAWLTAFAPADKPEIVITALLEAGGEGSKDAAPIAKKILEAYFKK